MAVFEKKEEELLSAKKMKELIQFLEGFHFAYNAMLSRRANVLDSIYANFARKLRVCKTKEECIDRVDELINRLDLQFPSFDEFKKGLWGTKNKGENSMFPAIMNLANLINTGSISVFV